MNIENNNSPVACISVDMDDLSLYRAVHGLPETGEKGLIYAKAMPRFLELFEKTGIKAAFFVVGQDVSENTEASSFVRKAFDSEHEIGNHTMSHFYNLVKLMPDSIEEQLISGENAIKNITGKKPAGFRAPGYNISPAVFPLLQKHGYVYDSSVLVSPPYFIARALIIASMFLTGKKSSSIAGNIFLSFRSRKPEKITGSDVMEMPISAATPLRLPVIGTTIAALDGYFFDVFYKSMMRLNFLNIEFHAIDLLDIEEDSIEKELSVEPVLRRKLKRRFDKFEKLLKDIKSNFQVLTLEHAASNFASK
jgi:hypothetical protein